jgi:hypothetical protein
MKGYLFFFFLLLSRHSFCQTVWHCEYSDSTLVRVPDSVINSIATDMKEKNAPDAVITAVLLKLSSGPVADVTKRTVIANDDSTMIVIESPDASQRILLKKDEIYIPDGNGSDTMVTTPHKIFKPTGKRPELFNYTCMEYISTDSTCTIWVAEDLPNCINPGIRVKNINGAVLFSEIKREGKILARFRIKAIAKSS